MECHVTSPDISDADDTTDTASNKNSSNAASNNANIDLTRFCTTIVPHFTPLGGSRPDAVVVACAVLWIEHEEGADEDVMLPPDVLDTALVMLCAPLVIAHLEDLQGREVHFGCPTATVILRTTDEDVGEALRTITAKMPGGALSVTVELEESITATQDKFMYGWKDDLCWEAVGWVDLARTSLRRIGSSFLNGCVNLTAVILPSSLTEVGPWFLASCHKLQSIDMRHTALLTVGKFFAIHCRSLKTVMLPDTVTDVRMWFLHLCGCVNVTSDSALVQAAAAAHELDDYPYHRQRYPWLPSV